MSDLEQRLTEALTARATDAPRVGDLAGAARSRHLRRRRSQAAGAAVIAMAVLVPVAVLGYGGRDHASQPEPLGPYKYGQHQKISSAVPADRAPGFQTLDYDVPSSNPPIRLGPHNSLGPTQEYLDIDAGGRLLATRISRHQPSANYLAATYQIVPGPHRQVRQVAAPPYDDETVSWTPHFTADGRLLWSPSFNILQSRWIDSRLTDVSGGNLERLVPPTSVAVPSSQQFPAQRGVWIDGGRAWFSAVTKAEGAKKERQYVSLFSFDPAHPQQVRREAAADVGGIDVANGEAVWIDATSTKVYAEDLTTRQVHEVPVPLGSGCRLVPNGDFAYGAAPDAIVTNGSLVALMEYCPDIRSTRELVTDLSGRLVTEFDPGKGHGIYMTVLSDQTIAFIVQHSGGDESRTYLDDLGTGELIDLGRQAPSFYNWPQIAGRYVMWYAGTAGHVGRLSGT